MGNQGNQAVTGLRVSVLISEPTYLVGRRIRRGNWVQMAGANKSFDKSAQVVISFAITMRRFRDNDARRQEKTRAARPWLWVRRAPRGLDVPPTATPWGRCQTPGRLVYRRPAPVVNLTGVPRRVLNRREAHYGRHSAQGPGSAQLRRRDLRAHLPGSPQVAAGLDGPFRCAPTQGRGAPVFFHRGPRRRRT